MICEPVVKRPTNGTAADAAVTRTHTIKLCDLPIPTILDLRVGVVDCGLRIADFQIADRVIACSQIENHKSKIIPY